mmetsp:Transcript_21538/g.36063  ORF Transcript_21538/g.36063 Transcript_21538/m.36063 type:complete len:210 (-) Transcript_21538:263-892(-)
MEGQKESRPLLLLRCRLVVWRRRRQRVGSTDSRFHRRLPPTAVQCQIHRALQNTRHRHHRERFLVHFFLCHHHHHHHRLSHAQTAHHSSNPRSLPRQHRRNLRLRHVLPVLVLGRAVCTWQCVPQSVPCSPRRTGRQSATGPLPTPPSTSPGSLHRAGRLLRLPAAPATSALPALLSTACSPTSPPSGRTPVVALDPLRTAAQIYVKFC